LIAEVMVMISRSHVGAEDRTYQALIAGLVGTVLASVVLLGAYGIASALAPAVGGVFGRWLAALTSNPATSLVQGALARAALLNVVIGLIWALVYAYLAEPRLPGAGWQRGALFALIPWFLSLVIFLPLVGGGVFGLALGAGPLPIIGNLIVHLVYGVSVGAVFAVGVEERAAGQADASAASLLANVSAERGLATGLVVCGIAGAVLSALGAVIAHGGSSTIWLAALVGGVFAATAGAVIGSFVGLSRATVDSAPSATPVPHKP
jgi:hypothetical protein